MEAASVDEWRGSLGMCGIKDAIDTQSKPRKEFDITLCPKNKLCVSSSEQSVVIIIVWWLFGNLWDIQAQKKQQQHQGESFIYP